jgi:hypothetical protein
MHGANNMKFVRLYFLHTPPHNPLSFESLILNHAIKFLLPILQQDICSFSLYFSFICQYKVRQHSTPTCAWFFPES